MYKANLLPKRGEVITMIAKKNNSKKVNNGQGKAFAAAMNAYTKALEPMSLQDFNSKIEQLSAEQEEAAKAAASLKAPESYEDREGYAEYCEQKMDLVMKEFAAIDAIYQTLSDYYAGNI